MKFFSKLACFTLLIAMAFSFGMAGPFISTVSAMGELAPKVGSSITIGRYVDSYDYDDVSVNSKIFYPDATIVGGGSLDITIYDSAFNEIEPSQTPDVTGDEFGNHNYFELPEGKIGSFYVVYKVVDNFITYEIKNERTIEIKVNGIRPAFNFDTNSPKIIPNKTTTAYPISLPNPEILDAEGEVITGAVASVKVNAPSGTVTLTDVGGYKTFTPSAKGIYTVTYSYKDAGTESIKQSFSITVVDPSTFKPDSDITLTMTTASAVPTTASLGVETVFPKATGHNAKASNANVNVFTEITIKYLGDTSVPDVKIYDYKYTFTRAGNYLVTYAITDFFGNTFSQTFSLREVRDNISPKVKVVDDYTAWATDATLVNGVIYIDTLDLEDFEDASYAIPSVIGLAAGSDVGATVIFPAIYAKDNVDTYDTLVDGNKFVREMVRKTGGAVRTLSTPLSGTGTAKPWEPVKYTFVATDEGEWTVRYKVYDTQVTNLPATLEFDLVIKEGVHTDDVAPVVEMPGIPATKQNGDKFTVLKPSVSDYTDATRTTLADNRVKIDVMYYFNDAYDNTDVDSSYQALLDGEPNLLKAAENEDDTAYYEFTIPAVFDFGAGDELVYSMTVEVFATDDAGNVGRLMTGTLFGKTVQIINTFNDNLAPKLVTAAGAAFSLSDVQDLVDQWTQSDLEQGKNIVLPSLSFMDDSDLIAPTPIEADPYITAGVKVFDPYGAEVPLKRVDENLADFVRMGDIVTIQNRQFNAVSSGTYTVVYTASDTAGNSYSFAYVLGAKNTTPPSVNPDNLPSTVEWGTLIDLKDIIVSSGGVTQDYQLYFNAPVIDANGDALDSMSWPVKSVYVSVTNDKIAPEFQLNSLIAKKGTYTVRYWAKDEDGNITKKYTEKVITASDSKAPVFTVGNDDAPDATHPYVSGSTTGENDIWIPGFASFDDKYKDKNGEYRNGSGVDESTAKVVVRRKSSASEIEKFDLIKNAGGTFTAQGDGIYEIIYSVADREGNTASRTFEMRVGDVEPPVITILSAANNLPGNQKVGYVLSIIKADDNGNAQILVDDDSITWREVIVKVTRDGNEITADSSPSDKRANYTLTETGNYVITYDVKDAAGNPAETIRHSFTVSADVNEPVVPSTVWGTVLLIVAILALGGVVFYFVMPARSSKPEKPSTRTKKTK